MFLAHLVFADVNGHSDMPVQLRAEVLQKFWSQCKLRKPRGVGPSPLSFYDVDNDSLMAGFSGVDRMDSAGDVLLWTIGLYHALASQGVPVSFGVGLATGRNEIDWDALPGFLPQLRTHLYFPDDQERLDGRVDRRHLIGDPLILAARLLSLAKKARAGIAFAFLPGDHPRYERIGDVQSKLRDAGVAPAFPLSAEMQGLPVAHREWAERWRIDPYGLIHTAEHIGPALVDQLSELGATGRAAVPPILQNLDEAWHLLMCGDEPWRQLAVQLPDDRLRVLTMGLVLYSQASGWRGGSVSPVIVLYREFLKRRPEDEPTFTAWIVANRRNGYEPFGTLLHGDARTQVELAASEQRWSQERAKEMAADLARQERAAAAKAVVATERLGAAVRRGDVGAVRALLDRGADWRRALPLGESLLGLARDRGRDAVAVLLEERGIG